MPPVTSVLTPDTFESFGDLLTYLRKRARLTQEELGRAVGYSRAQITRLERNQRLPDPATIVALFIPALDLDDKPELARRLIELVAIARGSQRVTVTHTIKREISESVESEESAPEVRNRLIGVPLPLLPLIGRENELALIQDRILSPATRLFTLIGPPGVGKTRLALQAAIGVGSAFMDGVRFISLAALTEPGRLPAVLLQILDMTDVAAGEETTRLLDVLRNKQLLLVLDNFEQILAAASLIADLLMNAAGLKVLVTSRSPLNVYGEYRFSVAPLLLPDLAHLPALADLVGYPSIALFVARARAVKPDFAVASVNALAVAAICARLDGLPLAIELAAAQSGLFAPQALLRGLVEKQPLLGPGPRNVPERHRTLADAIAWSYRQLGVDEQKLLAWLGVFAGGFNLATIVDFNLVTNTQDSLAALVDKSLVQARIDLLGETRFSLLETIREFALEQLAARGEMETAQRQHGGYFTALAERAKPEMNGAAQAEWLSHLQDELDNFRAALSWAHEHGQAEIELRLAGSLWEFWQLRGYLGEGRGWLQTALAKHSAEEPRLTAARAEALTGLGWMAMHQSDYAAARTHFEASLAMFEALGSKEEIASSLNNLGLLARHQGDSRQARSYFERSLALFRELGGRQGISWALSNLGLMTMEHGDYQGARPYMAEGLAIVRELGDQVGIARALNNLGIAAYHEADYSSARICYEESLAIKRQLGNKLGIAPTLENLGNVALRQGDFALAHRYVAEAVALSWELGNKGGIASGLEFAGEVAMAYGQPARAARLLAAAAELRNTNGMPHAPVDRVDYDRTRAAVRTALGDAAFDQAWTVGRQMTSEQAVSDALNQVV